MDSESEAKANTWSSKAAAKRASTLAKIYPEWRLAPEDIRRASTQRNLTGSFIQQFIAADDAAILSMDSVSVVDAIKQGRLTSLQVTTAFCKAAAVAHQIVSSPAMAYIITPNLHVPHIITRNCRRRSNQ